ncbi:MAG: trigger factor [Clostridiales bacterium]|nr:trigger factor [Clostridiales bacterium]
MYEIVRKENTEVEVKISLTHAEWETYADKAYQENKGKFNIQGFRKGAAPRKIIEKNYGEDVFFNETLDIAFVAEYTKFFEENQDLDIIDQPSITVDKFDADGVEIKAVAPLMPKVKLGQYTGLTIEKYTEEVDEAKVEKELNQARERAARFVDAGEGAEAKLGDFVCIDFTGSVNGVEFDGGKAENYRLELGSHSFIDNFEDQIVGMKVGEERDIKVTFPADYPAEELMGKEAVFKIVLHKIENKELPELNDEFAANTSEFETLQEYKADIRKHMQESIDKRVKTQNENKLIDAIVDGTEVEIPNCLIERQLDMFVRDFEMRLSYQGLKLEDYFKYTNSDMNALRENYREQAQKAVKTRLTLEELLKDQNLEVTEEELNAYFQKQADKFGKSVELYKKTINDQNLAYIKNELLMDKVFDYLTKNNTIA